MPDMVFPQTVLSEGRPALLKSSTRYWLSHPNLKLFK